MTGNKSLFGADERGVSEVLGAILVFGLLISLIAIIQMNAVPQANKDVEYQHSLEVRADMASLQDAISLTAIEGASKSSSVRLGVSYPPRFLFFNPGDTAGQLRTTDERDLSLDNVRGSGSAQTLYTGGDYDYATRALVYSADYKRLKEAPRIHHEVGVSHLQYPEGELVQGGTFVDDKQITLVTLNGSLQANGVAAGSIETVPISAPARTVSVTNTTGDRLTITVPTQLSNESWSDALESQYASNGGYIVEQSYTETGNGTNFLTIELEPGVTYELRMAQVGVGQNLATPTPAYQTVIEGNNETVLDNGIKQITVEVRDRYNNPIAGKTVNLSIVERPSSQDNGDFIIAGGTANSVTVTTAADGRATVTYQPPSITASFRDVDIRSSVYTTPPNPPTASFDLTDRNNTRIDVRVVDSGGPIGNPPKTPPNRFEVEDQSSNTPGTCILDICLTTGENASAYQVDWTVEDDRNDSPNSELDTVEIRLIKDNTGRIIDSVKYDIDGEMASGQATVGKKGGYGTQDLYVKLIYTDEGGYVRTARLPVNGNDRADGSGSWSCSGSC